MLTLKAIKEKLHSTNSIDNVETQGRKTLALWMRDDDGTSLNKEPWIEEIQFMELCKLLPDKIVTNLVKSRQARDGKIAMMKAGLGYEELLASIIVDGTAIASSSTEARLVPALLIPKNYLQPGGIPGKTLHWKLRGRITTLTTAATLTLRVRDGATDALTNTIAATGAITMDTTIQTASQWFEEGVIVTRSVGSAGTVFAQGDAMVAAEALTIANQHANFMGSAGQDTPSTLTIDMTTDRYFNWTAQWSLTTAYSITAHIMMLEALN